MNEDNKSNLKVDAGYIMGYIDVQRYGVEIGYLISLSKKMAEDNTTYGYPLYSTLSDLYTILDVIFIEWCGFLTEKKFNEFKKILYDTKKQLNTFSHSPDEIAPSQAIAIGEKYENLTLDLMRIKTKIRLGLSVSNRLNLDQKMKNVLSQ